MNLSASNKMYFIAIVCPPGPDNKILQYKNWMREHFGSVVALRSPSHITLIPPFWLEENKENNLKQAFQDIKIDLPELEISLDGFSHFGKKRLFARLQNNPSLEELKKNLENHFIAYFGDVIKKDVRPFHPHITIASRDLKPCDFEKAWQHFLNKTVKEKFLSQTISLLKLLDGKWHIIDQKIW